MLPIANRDTLAFIVLHLQRVAETPDCKMPAENLAKVFGPTVVGNSCTDPEPMQMITETRKQAAVSQNEQKIKHEKLDFIKLVVNEPPFNS